MTQADLAGSAPLPGTAPSDSDLDVREAMRKLPLFEGLSETDFETLYSMTRCVVLSRGDVLLREGDPGDAMYVLLGGNVEITRRTEDGDQVVAVRGQGELIGEMALLENRPRSATGRAVSDTRLLEIGRGAFQTLVTCSPDAWPAIVRTVLERLRSNEQLAVHQQKLAALGTLSAGLAHELNNPAAAIQRATQQLRETLDGWEQSLMHLAAAHADNQAAAIRALRAEVAPLAPGALDPLARGDRENALQDWLDDHDVPRAWELVEPLVQAGWDVAALERAAQLVAPAQLAPLVQSVAAGAAAGSLLDELALSARTIAEIVLAMKSYVRLDEAPIQAVDVHRSLEDTLVILRPKLRTGVEVVRSYAPDLPTIEAYGSDLNQVWTNLVDNAVDAMGGTARLVLHTEVLPDGSGVAVEVIDSGPGIPPKVQERMFDPFFTTKPIGQGSGMGLHTTYNVVVHKHHGRIEVHSRPGETCFRVTLPRTLAGT